MQTKNYIVVPHHNLNNKKQTRDLLFLS